MVEKTRLSATANVGSREKIDIRDGCTSMNINRIVAPEVDYFITRNGCVHDYLNVPEGADCGP